MENKKIEQLTTDSEAASASTALESDNACTNCGRSWSGKLNFCGVCGNRLIPYLQLTQFFPNKRFVRVKY